MSAEEETVTVERTPDWWHRDHPTFAALAGFFTGMLFVTAVPGGFIGLLRLMLPLDQAERFFPLVLLALLIPAGLLLNQRTNRFARYLLFGMAVTALIVLGVTSVVLWILVRIER